MSLDITEITVYIPVFLLIGLATFLLRAVFLFSLPRLMENTILKKGLSSVSSSLLVALVIPYTFFIGGIFSPWRVEVLVLLLVIPIVWFSKKPGFSLIFAVLIFFGVDILIPK